MAIVNNIFTQEKIDFYKSHIPFQSPIATIPVRNLNDVVTVNYNVPITPVVINQSYSSDSTFEFEIIIENGSINIFLEIEIHHDKHFTISTPKKFILNASTQRTVLVRVDNSYINSLNTIPVNKTNFKIIAKNTTDDLIYIPIDDNRLLQLAFAPEITVG
jgi:hypothetical protein